jgi:hypothetical protein
VDPFQIFSLARPACGYEADAVREHGLGSGTLELSARATYGVMLERIF